MTDSPQPTFERRREWALTTDSLQRLLNWLDGGVSSDGSAYVEMRRRLRDFFVRKSCRTPDDLADETLTRVARRLEEEGLTLTETPARYCYIVARFVFLEHLRETKTHAMVAPVSDDIALQPSAPSAADAAEAAGTREALLACLDRCIEALDPLNRRIITQYYIGPTEGPAEVSAEALIGEGGSVAETQDWTRKVQIISAPRTENGEAGKGAR